MTKEDFFLFEKMCKAIWANLCQTGDTEKPDIASYFKCGCPACDIAYQIPIGEDDYRCKYCPIVLWRENKNAPCEGYHGLPLMHKQKYIYRYWKFESDVIPRKKYAYQISNLEWEWMDKYLTVNINPKLLKVMRDYLKLFGVLK